MQSIAAHLEAIRSGRSTPSAVARDLVARLHGPGSAAGADPAWITLVEPGALLAAAAVLDDRTDLPLCGVPFAVKDNIDVAGLPTTAACPGFATVPTVTAPVVASLLQAGALLVGKTNLDQFATGLVGTRTPYGACASVLDPRYVSGGSSSGSAVVVADGTVVFALGTDTAGSGRVPAAFNGIVGLKPTRGVISTRGVLPASRSLDCVSVFTRDVADATRVLDVCAVPDAHDPFARTDGRDAGAPATWSPGDRVRLAVPDAAGLQALDGPARRGWESALAHAADDLAAEVVAVDIAPLAEAARLLYDGPWLAERYADLAAVLDARPAGLDPTVAAVVGRGATASAADAFRAMHRLAELRLVTRELLGGIDALLLPTAPTIPTFAEVAAEPIAVNRRLGTYTNSVNLLDLCAIAVPVLDRGGEVVRPPFGVTLVAVAGADRTLLALAAAWTAAVPQAVPASVLP
ncbi:Allophanate hydrolase [Paraconexibacter sp. AEG42_29]|uniref:Allophanate hydrolase n=1 Tax=Paraconexibacter sp. AEG42_29 TaxID=2997339 RepID=A0AAU7AUQ1_9ACTN